jgi:hypothetical protein
MIGDFVTHNVFAKKKTIERDRKGKKKAKKESILNLSCTKKDFYSTLSVINLSKRLFS